MKVSRKPPVARSLSARIETEKLTREELADVANVTLEYVDYLCRFAINEDQTWFLTEILRRNRKPPNRQKKPVWVHLNSEVKRSLEETGNMSETVRKIYERWKHEHQL